MKRKVLIFSIILSVFVVFSVSACGKKSNNGEKGSKDNPIKIGVVGAADKQWDIFKQKAKNQGIYVDIVDFQDYTSENPALSTGQLDMNLFQHILYLANYNSANNDDLQPIGASAIYPMGLYTENNKNINDIPKGSKIAIPNDDTNQARAIKLLEDVKLIKIKGNKLLPSPADVDTLKSKVTVVPIKAEQAPDALKDPKIEGAVINNDFIGDAGINFNDAIYKENPDLKSVQPYINIFAVKNINKDNALYKKLVEIFHDKDVTDALEEKSGNTALICNNSADDLQKVLIDLQNKLKK